jgi:response regulator RpfG family c-di-GMP phosphodiesterase
MHDGAMTMTDDARIPVLLVDDRQENLTSLRELLESPGLDICEARSGEEALRLSLKHDFAIVLMDVRMPDMDGIETAELMRSNPKTRDIPIIFITGHLQDANYQFKGYEAGAVDYLLKPIEPIIVRSKVRVFCDLYRQRRRLELREQNLEGIIAKRTAELRDINERLQLELTERRRAEEQLRTLTNELEQRVGERTAELAVKNAELMRTNKLFIGRELKMVELKERIRELERLQDAPTEETA